MREKAEQGHWPSVAPIGDMKNLSTHRIEIDPCRGALVSELFRLYATGRCALKALVVKAHAVNPELRSRARASRSSALSFVTRRRSSRTSRWSSNVFAFIAPACPRGSLSARPADFEIVRHQVWSSAKQQADCDCVDPAIVGNLPSIEFSHRTTYTPGAPSRQRRHVESQQPERCCASLDNECEFMR